MSIDDQIAKYLADPLNFPPEYKSWHGKYLETHQPSLQAGLLAGKLPTSKLTGQIPYLQLTLANSIVSADIVDGTIVNADLSATAAVAASKLAGYPTDASKGLDGAGNWTGSLFKIYHAVLGGAGTFDTLAVIPATFSHLRVEFYGTSDQATTGTVLLRLNNDSGGNYDFEQFAASAATGSASEVFAATSATIGYLSPASASGGRPGGIEVVIPNYANTSLEKTFNAYGNAKGGTASGNLLIRHAGVFWRSTAAINRIALTPSAGNFVANSSFTVYGMGV